MKETDVIFLTSVTLKSNNLKNIILSFIVKNAYENNCIVNIENDYSVREVRDNKRVRYHLFKGTVKYLDSESLYRFVHRCEEDNIEVFLKVEEVEADA